MPRQHRSNDQDPTKHQLPPRSYLVDRLPRHHGQIGPRITIKSALRFLPDVSSLKCLYYFSSRTLFQFCLLQLRSRVRSRHLLQREPKENPNPNFLPNRKPESLRSFSPNVDFEEGFVSSEEFFSGESWDLVFDCFDCDLFKVDRIPLWRFLRF